MSSLALALPGGALQLHGEDEVLAALGVLFGPLGWATTATAAPPRLSVHIARAPGGYVATPSGVQLADLGEVMVWCDDLVRTLFAAWNPAATHVHAACVLAENWTYLIAGASGAGKSSLAHAAVRGGAQYWTDEYALLAADGLSGLARAIQYDAVPVGSPAPAADCDMQTYAFRGRGPARVVRPLGLVRAAAAATKPGDPSRVVLVLPQVGATTSLRAVGGAEALAALLAQVTHGPFVDLLPLVRRAVAITWCDADDAWRALRQWPQGEPPDRAGDRR